METSPVLTWGASPVCPVVDRAQPGWSFYKSAADPSAVPVGAKGMCKSQPRIGFTPHRLGPHSNMYARRCKS
jgi:hypothetical protein